VARSSLSIGFAPIAFVSDKIGLGARWPRPDRFRVGLENLAIFSRYILSAQRMARTIVVEDLAKSDPDRLRFSDT